MALNQSAAWATSCCRNAWEHRWDWLRWPPQSRKIHRCRFDRHRRRSRVTGLKVGITGIRQHRWFWPDTSKRREGDYRPWPGHWRRRPTSAWVRQLPRRRSHECSCRFDSKLTLSTGHQPELSSPLPMGNVSACCGGIISQHPADKCQSRYKLAYLRVPRRHTTVIEHFAGE